MVEAVQARSAMEAATANGADEWDVIEDVLEQRMADGFRVAAYPARRDAPTAPSVCADSKAPVAATAPTTATPSCVAASAQSAGAIGESKRQTVNESEGVRVESEPRLDGEQYAQHQDAESAPPDALPPVCASSSHSVRVDDKQDEPSPSHTLEPVPHSAIPVCQAQTQARVASPEPVAATQIAAATQAGSGNDLAVPLPPRSVSPEPVLTASDYWV